MDTLNSSGFKSFFVSYYDRCFLFVKSYVHDDWVAEDIATGSLIKLWEITLEKEIDNPKALLFTIMKHKALDYLKHESVRQNVLSSVIDYSKRELEIRIATLEACIPERIFATDIQEIIDKTLADLPELTRQIFVMSRFKNQSKKEIAALFGISVKGVDYHIAKALSQLRNNLKDYLPLLSFLFL